MTDPLPLSPRMSYGQMRMALYDVAPDLHVASAWLPGKLDGIYCRGGKLEQRCRHETAILLINPAEYALAERMYDGNPYQIAAELNVTIQIIQDYRQWLHDNVTV